MYNQISILSIWCKLVNYLYCLAGMAAIVGEDGRDSLQDFASVSPGYHQTEEAGAGQGSDGLSCRVIGSRAPNCGFQQQLKERFWKSIQVAEWLWERGTRKSKHKMHTLLDVEQLMMHTHILEGINMAELEWIFCRIVELDCIRQHIHL